MKSMWFINAFFSVFADGLSWNIMPWPGGYGYGSGYGSGYGDG